MEEAWLVGKQEGGGNMDAVLDDEEMAAELRDIVMECHLQTLKNRRWG